MALLKYEALYYILCRVKKEIDYDLRSLQSIKCYFTYMWCYLHFTLANFETGRADFISCTVFKMSTH